MRATQYPIPSMVAFQQVQLSSKSDIPLVAQLVDQLTWLIASGKLVPGDTLPPIRQLAAQLGVNMHTIRQAYHRLESDGLVDVRRRRGTVVLAFDPVRVSRNRKVHLSFLLGVLLPAPVPVYKELLEAVHQSAEQHGWMPLIGYCGDSTQAADRYFNQLVAKGVDGLIVVSVPVIAALLELGKVGDQITVVHIDSPAVSHNSLLADSEKAAFLATEHLIEHGYREIGLVTPPLHWENVSPCFQGYQRALQSVGMQVETRLVTEVSDFDRSSGQQGIKALLKNAPGVEAAFFAADSLALGAIKALREQELNVPNDFALTSYNDTDEAGLVSPGLTSASFPSFELGKLAVDQLIAQKMAGKRQGSVTVLDTQLVIRGSCGCNP